MAPTDRPLHHPRPGIYNAVLRSDRFGTPGTASVYKMRLRADPYRSQITETEQNPSASASGSGEAGRVAWWRGRQQKRNKAGKQRDTHKSNSKRPQRTRRKVKNKRLGLDTNAVWVDARQMTTTRSSDTQAREALGALGVQSLID